MPKIVLENITKRWDKFYAVEDLNLVIEDNAFVTLLGPSGCGKTTTLRMIAGLETPTSGKITIGDRVVYDSSEGINIPANKRKVGFLFQNYALWPNMTVYQNISFGLTNIKEEMDEIDFTARTNNRLAEILSKPEEVVKIVEECYDKNGKIDNNKLNIKLIDRFEISTYTAKKLIDYKLQDASDLKGTAKKLTTELKESVEQARTKAAQSGCTLSDDFRLMKDGKPVRKLRKLTKEEIDLSVRRVSRIVKIGMFMDRYPAELSGGQQQRVAIARTLAPEPTVLFMDEPLSNLDAKLRLEMRSELQRLHLETGSTFVYVTHDQMEAMTLATRICLIDNGVLQQYDAPLTVYSHPNNLFVADFVGNPAINFVEAKGTQNADGKLELSLFDGKKAEFTFNEPTDIAEWYSKERIAEKAAREAHERKAAQKGYVEKGNKDTVFKYHLALVNDVEDYGDEVKLTDEDFVLGIRPEAISISPNGRLEGEIYSSMPTGMETTVRVAVGNYILTGVMFGGVAYKLGEKKNLDFLGDSIILFSRSNGKIIGIGSLKVN
ncbi:MAG: ATP-binding cassette domain-containing protein [Erysipelotrichaceae bacterium]|nr:ATP-binding cassette domain-containing protein [Erysipelotrichaceae bacterium]